MSAQTGDRMGLLSCNSAHGGAELRRPLLACSSAVLSTVPRESIFPSVSEWKHAFAEHSDRDESSSKDQFSAVGSDSHGKGSFVFTLLAT